MARTRSPEVVQTPWFIRLGLYVVVAAVGLVLTVLGYTQPDQVDGWLDQVGRIAALVGGLLAAVNVTKDTKKPTPAEPEPAPMPTPAPSSTGNQLLDQLRDRIAQNRG